jgi:hypothetical protein
MSILTSLNDLRKELKGLDKFTLLQLIWFIEICYLSINSFLKYILLKKEYQELIFSLPLSGIVSTYNLAILSFMKQYYLLILIFSFILIFTGYLILRVWLTFFTEPDFDLIPNFEHLKQISS